MKQNNHKLHIKLMELLDPYATWYEVDEETNKGAEKTLISFHAELLKIKPTKEYHFSMSHTFYLQRFLAIRKAFEEKCYARVSNEIQDLLHEHLITQPRVYYNMIKILEYYLDVGEKGNV